VLTPGIRRRATWNAAPCRAWEARTRRTGGQWPGQCACWRSRSVGTLSRRPCHLPKRTACYWGRADGITRRRVKAICTASWENTRSRPTCRRPAAPSLRGRVLGTSQATTSVPRRAGGASQSRLRRTLRSHTTASLRPGKVTARQASRKLRRITLSSTGLTLDSSSPRLRQTCGHGWAGRTSAECLTRSLLVAPGGTWSRMPAGQRYRARRSSTGSPPQNPSYDKDVTTGRGTQWNKSLGTVWAAHRLGGPAFCCPARTGRAGSARAGGVRGRLHPQSDRTELSLSISERAVPKPLLSLVGAVAFGGWG